MLTKRKLFCAISFCAILFTILCVKKMGPNYEDKLRQSLSSLPDKQLTVRPKVEETLPTIALSFVVCGDRLHEALVLAKSAILFQMKYPLKFYIFADNEQKQSLEEKLSDWQVLAHHSFSFEILSLQFPKDSEKMWKTLFKTCACQRLFIPDILQEVDAILYMDVDTVFMGPVYEVWKHFDLMNDTQIVGVAKENEDTQTGWYSRFARHPFYGPTGVNSGVMLMNLTRMRQFGWGSYLYPIYKEYKTKLVYGDQDIINIIFYYHPENLYLFPCRYNYRTDHCRYMLNCKSAADQGIIALHGSRSSFNNNRTPAFTAIFQAFQEYQLGEDPHERILLTLEKSYLPDTAKSPCGHNFKNIYLQEMNKVFRPWRT